MPLTISEIQSILKPWELVILTTKGTPAFNNKQGYAGKSFEENFEFHVVQNEYEHFSNISADPITKVLMIRYEDVVEIRKTGF
jgi:hypothetical protein